MNADGVITNAPEQLFDMRQIGPLPEKTDPQPSEVRPALLSLHALRKNNVITRS